MTYSKKQREQYNLDRVITCRELGITENQYNKFRRLGDELHQLYEQNCNGELGEGEYEIKTEALYKITDKFAEILGLQIFYQTDPRGATIYLSKEAIADNNYNRSGSHCIY